MSDYKQFYDEAKKQLKSLGEDLDKLDECLKNADDKSDAWYSDQMQKLRHEWKVAKNEIDRKATDIHSNAKATAEQVKKETECHWKALQAAIQTYREQVELNVGRV